jgi:SOS-response transcriptional repressor LexA
MKNLEDVLEVLMTEKQRTVFLVIDEYWKRFGYGPSVDDVMSLTGDKGRGNVHRVMKKLIQMGACKGLPNSARSIRPTYVSFRKLQ